MKQGFENPRGYLVAQYNDDDYRQNRTKNFFPIPYDFRAGFPVNKDKKKTQIKRNPYPFSGIKIEKGIPKRGIASIQKEKQPPFPLQFPFEHSYE
jgi:hypothetical protein